MDTVSRASWKVSCCTNIRFSAHSCRRQPELGPPPLADPGIWDLIKGCTHVHDSSIQGLDDVLSKAGEGSVLTNKKLIHHVFRLTVVLSGQVDSASLGLAAHLM